MTVPLRNRYADPSMHFVAERTSVQRLLQNRAAWARLAENAVEPNPFYEPDYLAASLAMQGEDIPCIAIFRDGSRESDLIGLFPLQRARIFDGALMPALEFYRNEYTCLTTPLIHRDDPVGVWDAFLDRCAHTPDQPRKIFGTLMATTGPAMMALHEALAARWLTSHTFNTYERACAIAPERFETAFRQMGRNRRSDIGRRRRKLRAMGQVTFSAVTSGDKSQALEEFLRLEAAGWKGQAGTAMASHKATEAFARTIFSAENAEFDLLSLDGHVIAVLASVMAGGTLFTIKSAYDESLAPYSPGLLLNVHLLRRISGQQQYKGLDSCAIADHVVNDYWLDRKPIGTVAFATETSVSTAQLEQMARLMTSAQRLKGWLKEHILRR